MAEKRYMNEAAKNIRKKLTEIRRQGYREDPSNTPPLLYLLGYRAMNERQLLLFLPGSDFQAIPVSEFSIIMGCY